MNIADLWRRLHESKLRETAFRVARQCEREIVALVAPPRRSMNEHQARGYIKARAGLLVERSLRETISSGRGLSAAKLARLESIALDAVCLLVQKQLAMQPVVVTVPVRKVA